MALFGSKSMARLKTCHPDLQRLVLAVAEEFDLCVICGERNKEDQNAAYALGATKLKYPHSKHNMTPSRAVDLSIWPIQWYDHKRFRELGETMKAHADKLGIPIVWGGDWKTFKDLPHYELAE